MSNNDNILICKPKIKIKDKISDENIVANKNIESNIVNCE